MTPHPPRPPPSPPTPPSRPPAPRISARPERASSIPDPTAPNAKRNRRRRPPARARPPPVMMLGAADPPVAPSPGAARSPRAAIRKKETSRARAEADKTGEQEPETAVATEQAPAKRKNRQRRRRGKSVDLGGRRVIKTEHAPNARAPSQIRHRQTQNAIVDVAHQRERGPCV